jgi:hypothetical protein
MPSIPSIGVNLVITNGNSTCGTEACAQVSEHIRCPLSEAVQEGGVPHNEIQKDEEVQEMITFQPNS